MTSKDTPHSAEAGAEQAANEAKFVADKPSSRDGLSTSSEGDAASAGGDLQSAGDRVRDAAQRILARLYQDIPPAVTTAASAQTEDVSPTVFGGAGTPAASEVAPVRSRFEEGGVPTVSSHPVRSADDWEGYKDVLVHRDGDTKRSPPGWSRFSTYFSRAIVPSFARHPLGRLFRAVSPNSLSRWPSRRSNSARAHIPTWSWTDRAPPYLVLIGRYAGLALAGWFAIVVVLIFVYRFVNPPASNLMLYEMLTGVEVKQSWVPLRRISSHVRKAVIMAEDAKFCSHWGIDFGAIEEAIENADGRTPRGASTISMQTAKNLFLWQSKSYVRKLIEVPLTVIMEIVWPKQRMLEIYLNIAEWGPGVFGVGAAARHHFGSKPEDIGPYAAALLAAALPNPRIRNAGHPGPRTRRKAGIIAARARSGGDFASCVLNSS